MRIRILIFYFAADQDSTEGWQVNLGHWGCFRCSLGPAVRTCGWSAVVWRCRGSRAWPGPTWATSSPPSTTSIRYSPPPSRTMASAAHSSSGSQVRPSTLFELACRAANEGRQYKCLVPIYVFPEMKLCTWSLLISKTNRIVMLRMRSSLVVWTSDCQCTSCNGSGSIPASVGTVESEGRQMKQCWM